MNMECVFDYIIKLSPLLGTIIALITFVIYNKREWKKKVNEKKMEYLIAAYVDFTKLVDIIQNWADPYGKIGKEKDKVFTETMNVVFPKTYESYIRAKLFLKRDIVKVMDEIFDDMNKMSIAYGSYLTCCDKDILGELIHEKRYIEEQKKYWNEAKNDYPNKIKNKLTTIERLIAKEIKK